VAAPSLKEIAGSSLRFHGSWRQTLRHRSAPLRTEA